MSRLPIALALSFSMIGCVSITALEPPQVSSAGKDARNDATTYEELGLEVHDLASDLDTPWSLVMAPDGWIWFTERPGRVSRVNPESGAFERIARVPSLERGESGLMGLELHPDFPATPYVYLMQSYEGGSGIANRLVRYTYRDGSLSNEEVLLDSILGNTFHDGARLAAGPDGYLYVTTGDAGRESLSQDPDSLNGKTLRLTWDGEPAPDNPFGNEVYSYGHRNAQGLTFHPRTGALFITEHGPDDNDEVAIVAAGENHGWPRVHGFCDGDVRGEEEFCGDHEIAEPLAAWTPTIAPAGADFYEGRAIPDWQGDFLFVTLKGSSLIRLELGPDARSVVAQQVISQGAFGRLRDVLVDEEGIVYIATSNRDGRGVPAADDDRILMVRP
ncbi:MAG: PQQ-dependent sugar dehydrogenase [Spirochaetota bacterium]